MNRTLFAGPMRLALLGMIALLALLSPSLRALQAFDGGRTPLDEASASVEEFVQVGDDGSVALRSEIGDGSPAGLSPEQLGDFKSGVSRYNQAIQHGDPGTANKPGGAIESLLNFLVPSAGAWNSNWVSCGWNGCTFAIDHWKTQGLKHAISNTSAGQLYGSVLALCFQWALPAAWACPALAGVIVVAGKVFAWQLGNMDRGGGVYIYATYWKSWPGITSQ